MTSLLASWDELDDGKYEDETVAVARLLAMEPLGSEAESIQARAEALVRGARGHAGRRGAVESFLQEFALSSPEGLALMCLAEALLRTPDPATRDALIAEKIGSADWASHVGRSDSLFVNASAFGLMLTGRLVDPDRQAKDDLPGFLRRLAERLGEPVIRRAVAAAIGVMSDQFVLGRTIESALARAAREGWVASFDMLGEGARTYADAERYEAAYRDAIAKVGEAAGGVGPERGHGVSVKLSALHPRFEPTQEARVFAELYPRLLGLARLAAEADVHLTIDAEEADRLTLSLKLIDRLAREPSLGGWRGLGVAAQAYQKRGAQVIQRLARLAEDSGRRLMVRLVKGAYWDAEIKRAQVAGRPDYPVFTTKPATDLSYLVCAQALIGAAPALYPQFATHNAHTLAAVTRLAERASVAFERQRLHGMGEALYAAAREAGDFPLRVYAPVGGHEDLLPYLVRRLLENGANTSFVHALLDKDAAPAVVARDPVAQVRARPGPHPKLPGPRDALGPERKSAAGLDLSIAADGDLIAAEVARLDERGLGEPPPDASPAAIEAAFAAARSAQGEWDVRGGPARGRVLRAMADAVEGALPALVALLAREAGKVLADAVAEVREAADFCRYYAVLAERDFAAPKALPGPAAERNSWELHGRGVFVAISPWNFPLSIFTGQIAAALAAGCAVIAKPAEQTPRIAAEAVRLFHQAGLPPALLALAPGGGESVGQALIAHRGCDGVAFTGGTDTALAINRALAGRQGPIVPFIAETGGLNGLFVDTSALREQVIDDVIVSAFGAAGQRCSSLRLLFLPEERADELIEGIAGAMDALVIADPTDPATDVGPLIDAAAKAALEAHAERLAREARIVRRLAAPQAGCFFGPILAEVPRPDFLDREVFGPILHVFRYRREDLESIAARFAGAGYGLTLGVHSRLESFADEIRRLVPAGNTYVNRSIIGAVVGVQPFGGEGLSGTGPKAGGPLALTRFAVERVVSVNTAAEGGDPALFNL
jgi:RHH-type proline utilization regulon transcriptional repressor/proline dehydrogenase/delta 1-pyrroline-5-carboxylate dehydrogenase